MEYSESWGKVLESYMEGKSIEEPRMSLSVTAHVSVRYNSNNTHHNNSNNISNGDGDKYVARTGCDLRPATAPHTHEPSATRLAGPGVRHRGLPQPCGATFPDLREPSERGFPTEGDPRGWL